MIKSLLRALLAVGAAVRATDVIPVDYSHMGEALQGFKVVPNEPKADQIPAVVVIPDWDGVNDYEKQRATMLAQDLGYVGFAADIYGADLHFVEDIDQRMELASLYRDNATLFAERIWAAVELVQTFDEVDPEKVALIGYCFGGTGVLTYALTGYENVTAIVSFHGGLGSLPDAGPAVQPKVLVLSGGEDDASTDIMDLEATLDNATATWEITRYSGIEHAFTVFDDERYNEWADTRSWESMTEFLKESFGELEYESNPPNTTNAEEVEYMDVDGTNLKSYIAMPSDEWRRPLPGVLIIPDWDGNNEYEQERATLLAEMGYVAFAADIYGADLQQNLTMDQRIEQASKYRADPELFVQRMQRALEAMKTYRDVDTENIAAIGYCFGGTGIIQLAFSGNDEVKIVVSFHGGLTDLPFPEVAVKPYTLILSGGADDAHGNQTELEAALNEGNATWETTRYAGVEHGFTVWGNDGYSPVADFRSWQSMKHAFEERMPVPTKSGSGQNTTSAAGSNTLGQNTTSAAGSNTFAAVWSMGVAATVAAIGVFL